MLNDKVETAHLWLVNSIGITPVSPIHTMSNKAESKPTRFVSNYLLSHKYGTLVILAD